MQNFKHYLFRSRTRNYLGTIKRPGWKGWWLEARLRDIFFLQRAFLSLPSCLSFLSEDEFCSLIILVSSCCELPLIIYILISTFSAIYPLITSTFHWKSLSVDKRLRFEFLNIGFYHRDDWSTQPFRFSERIWAQYTEHSHTFI